jgi:hypothetical protein
MWLFHIFFPFWLFAGFCIAAILADLISTHIALKKGFHEWNPIMEKTGHPVLFSAILSAIIMAFLIWAYPYEPNKSSWFCFFCGLYRGACATINIIRLRKGKTS